ncbi:het domain-containing protein [Colletotrichum chrysophilum]|uniref:Het domain-containing protein n=1 Tax=Colletotrichum chrysophilum TaxID=1836956 RepID=A0AAD9EP05_9PEZI|nr:het domain-containing protein [Colletotrichum chrysophilum]
MGIASDDLTNLFKDAIQLRKEVGCDYIWIDSLCIVQDDNSDWTTQSQKMAEIYTNAHFNIAATSSANSHQGLFKERWTLGTGGDLARYPLLVYEVNNPSVPGHAVFVRPAHRRDHGYITGDILRSRWLQAPLLQRAWVFQELMLARRTLHVCASELIWECKTLTTCECGALYSKSSHVSTEAIPSSSQGLFLDQIHRKQAFTSIRDKRSPLQNTHDFWLMISGQYSDLHLSKPSDRLAAFTGLVNAVQRVTNGTYVRGMWIEDLPRALLWGGAPRSDSTAFRSSDAPTWSRMSRRRPDGSCLIGYASVLSSGFRQDPRTSVTYVSGSHLPTKGNQLEIIFHGPTISAKVQKIVSSYEFESELRSDTEFYVQMAPHLQESSDSNSYLLDLDCPMSPNDLVQEGDMVECLLLGTNDDMTFHHILVVSKCLSENEGYYKRIGISDIDLKDDEETYSDIAEISEIVII